MKVNKLKSLVAGSLILVGVATNADATVYNFSDGTTLFATLDVNSVNATQFTFNLSFLNTTTNIGNNHFFRRLGVNNVNNADASDVTFYVTTPSSSSIAPSIGVTSGFPDYDFDFIFSDTSGATNRLGVAESASWVSSFNAVPGNFSGFQLQVVNQQGNGAQNFVGVEAVPEPETYAMFLAGLGLLGFVARRKQA